MNVVAAMLFLQILFGGIRCLVMEGIVVPPYIHQGEGTELRCQFRLDRDNLYSVTWYKDHEEFYRYVPRDNPKQRTYKLDGAKIDQLRSGVHVVKLKAATSAASGVYRCEVSAEAPSFTSAHAEGRMDVVSLPTERPEITGDIFARDYREGDILALNCTAGKSHPPAKVRWYVNEKHVNAWSDIKGESDGKAISSLRLQLTKDHFYDGLLTVRCKSTVGPLSVPFDVQDAFLFVRGSAHRIIFVWKNICIELLTIYYFIKHLIS